MLIGPQRLLAAFCISCFAPVLSIAQLSAPPSAPQIPVTENIHGLSITDNYRWLEDQNSPQTRAWIKAEQKYTAAFFNTISDREQIRSSLEKIVRVESVSVPLVVKDRYFFTRRLPSEQQASLFVRSGVSGGDVLLVNPNALFPDHSVSVSIGDVSRDGRILAYQLRKGGQDETETHFLDVDSKKDLPDILPPARTWLVQRYSFTPDNKAIYYTRMLDAGPRVYRHTFGSPMSRDQEIFGSEYGPQYIAACGITRTTKYLFCQTTKGAAGAESDIYIQRLGVEKGLRCIAQHMPVVLGIAPYRDHLAILTRWQAAKGRVLDIDLDHPASNHWKEIIHEGAAPLEGISVAANKLFVIMLENVSMRCRAFAPDGTPAGEVKLPAPGDVAQIEGEEDGSEAFLGFNSFAYPDTIFKLSSDNTLAVWWRPNVPLALDQVETKQVWYVSKDGTKVPMFIVAKKGQAQRVRPTLLSGYGGFDIAMIARWSPIVAWWVEQGGVYAQPALRGGSEFGEAWHRAGMFQNKQNVFDDFIAAAEYLINSGITSREKLAIYGVSNGGLLVGAAMTQRPDLFRAVVCGAPLLDMVRYQKFKIANLWISEYGSSDDPKQFPYLYRYSPYHHVEKSVNYPAVLFYSGDSDTRVDPLHARKMTALMQSSAAPGKPILIRYDTLVGHSGGLSVDRLVDLDTDILAFLKSQIG